MHYWIQHCFYTCYMFFELCYIIKFCALLQVKSITIDKNNFIVVYIQFYTFKTLIPNFNVAKLFLLNMRYVLTETFFFQNYLNKVRIISLVLFLYVLEQWFEIQIYDSFLAIVENSFCFSAENFSEIYDALKISVLKFIPQFGLFSLESPLFRYTYIF